MTRELAPPRRGVGRPEVEVDIGRLRELSALGLNAEHIAARLGVSRRTLFARLESDTEARAAIDAGIAESVEFAATALQRLGAEGNLGALIFFLKTKGGFNMPKDPTVIVNGAATVEVAVPEGIIERIDGFASRTRLMLAERDSSSST